jgi:hypothetical protein
LGTTPPFRGPKGEIVPGSIAEVNYLRLGGLDIPENTEVATVRTERETSTATPRP